MTSATLLPNRPADERWREPTPAAVLLFLLQERDADDGLAAAVAADAAGRVVVHALEEPAEASRPRTLEAMATQRVRALRSVQPRGPYRIAGAGLHGVLAHEVAIQLLGQDQAVDFVGLVDAPCPATPAAEATPSLQALRDAAVHYVAQPSSLPLHLLARAPDAGQEESNRRWQSVAARARMHAVDAGDAQAGHALRAALSQAMPGAAEAVSPERQHSAHVVIQSGARGQSPVLCVPGAGDSVIGFIPLGEALGARFPLHGLQPRGIDGLLVPHATVEAAAAFYLEATAAVRRGEPVHLVGHSFGGWIAFEMASQLLAANVAVRSLTIIDSEAPAGIGVLGSEYTQTEVLVELVRVMELSTGASLQVDLDALRSASRAERLRLLHEGMIRVGLMPRRSSPAALQGLTRTFGTALRTTYRPERPHRGRIGLVLARDTHLDDAGNVRKQAQMLDGWRRWAPDLVAWTTPADHFSVLRQPHVGALADWWRATMAAH